MDHPVLLVFQNVCAGDLSAHCAVVIHDQAVALVAGVAPGGSEGIGGGESGVRTFFLAEKGMGLKDLGTISLVGALTFRRMQFLLVQHL